MKNNYKKIVLVVAIIFIIIGIIYIVSIVINKNNVISGDEISASNEIKNFELKFIQRKDLGIKEIYDTGEYKIKTFSGDVVVIRNDIDYSLEDALNQNIITGEDILNNAERDVDKNCEKHQYLDGGSTEYLYPEYTILKLNHEQIKMLDSNGWVGEYNHDLVIGMKGEILDKYEKQNQ